MQGMKGHEMWAVVHPHCAAELLVHMYMHDASRGNLDGWCAYTCMAPIAVYWWRSARCPRRISWSQSWDSERLLPAENRPLPGQTHVSLPSVHSPLLHDLEGKVSSSTSWTCLGQLLRQWSTTPLSLRRKSTRYSSTKTSKESCQSLFERRSQCVLSNMTPEARKLLTSQCMT